jgi:hypothetical protein
MLFIEPGFVLSLDSTYGTDLRLHKVFGTFLIENVEPWKPFKGSAGEKGSGMNDFLSKLSIPMPRVQLMLSDLFEAGGPSVGDRFQKDGDATNPLPVLFPHQSLVCLR